MRVECNDLVIVSLTMIVVALVIIIIMLIIIIIIVTVITIIIIIDDVSIPGWRIRGLPFSLLAPSAAPRSDPHPRGEREIIIHRSPDTV